MSQGNRDSEKGEERVKRLDFEKYLGEFVSLKLFDGSCICGVLRKTGEEAFRNNPNLSIPRNYYFVTKTKESNVCASCLFRVSHVKKIKKYREVG